jgi:hypothetical protein
MSAPRCTCISILDLHRKTARVLFCPLHTAAKDLYESLERIARWFGEFPPTGRTWSDGKEMSYSSAFGANGERDYMREVARAALLKANPQRTQEVEDAR